MSDSTLPPEQWRPLFDKIGVEFGYRPFAAYIDMDHTRLRRLLRGGGTSAAAIQQVADGFGVDPAVVRELRGEGRQHVEPFTLPDDAGRLNETERNVVRAVVRALLDARDNAHADQPAAATPATTEDTQDPQGEDQKTFDFDAARVGAPSSDVDGALAATSADLATLPPEDARAYATIFGDATNSQRALEDALRKFADAVLAADNDRIGQSLDTLESRINAVLSCYDAIAARILTRVSGAPLQELAPLRAVRNGDHLRLLDALRNQTRELILPGLPAGHPLEDRFRAQLERIENTAALDAAWREAVAQREADLVAREQKAVFDSPASRPRQEPSLRSGRPIPADPEGVRASERRAQIEVYEDAAGKFRFRIKAGNGEVLASGQAYASRKGAHYGAAAVVRAVEAARVDPELENLLRQSDHALAAAKRKGTKGSDPAGLDEGEE